MAGWKQKPWFSPRAIIAPVRLSENTVRYQKVLVEEEGENDLEEVTPKKNTYPSWGGKMYSNRVKLGNYDNDDDDYTFLRPKKEKKWSFSQTRWSSYSYGSAFGTDNDENLIVKAPDNYLTPTSQEIRNKINVYNQDAVNIIKEACRVCYLKMINDKDFLSEDAKKAVKEGSSVYIGKEEFERRVKLYTSIFDEFIPGTTPLEQARAIYHKIKDQHSSFNRQSAKSSKDSGYIANFKRDVYADPTINSQIYSNKYSKEEDLSILNNISLIGEFGSQFTVEKEVGEKIVHNSDKFKNKHMTSLDQLNMVNIAQRVLPNFKAKLITKDLIISAPVQTSEQKQKIIILVDYSGSMNERDKQNWVNGILIDRFKYVIKGEAEVFFSFFVSKPDQLNFIHVKNEEDVKKFWENFSNYPCGSTTDIGRIVQYVASEISKGKLHNLKINLSQEKPEILIINDGQIGLDV